MDRDRADGCAWRGRLIRADRGALTPIVTACSERFSITESFIHRSMLPTFPWVEASVVTPDVRTT